MLLNEEELVMLIIIAYGGMYPSIRGIPSVLPIGVDNVLKWKNQIGMEKVTKKVQKKFKAQGMWFGKEEFEKKIMPVAVNELEVAFKTKEHYTKSFFNLPMVMQPWNF